MRRMLWAGLGLGLATLTGCGTQATSFVKSDTTLGRVVVYRNGVAYFERYANVEGDTLRLAVPGDKVDDFLKSLTVVDAKTGQPAPISYPSRTSGDGVIDMRIQLPPGASRKVKLSYVTEAPSWKPSYRIMALPNGKVSVQAWAIVDNTSGEDWNQVKLGVGSSSAMSFRFDLRSLRVVQRETLHQDNLFAVAPPMGGATYGQPGSEKKLLTEMSDAAIAQAETTRQEEPSARNGDKKTAPAGMPMPKARPRSGTPADGYGAGAGRGMPGNTPAAPPAQVAQQAAQMQALASRANASSGAVVIEGFAAAGDRDRTGAALDRANRVREQMIQQGADPNKVVAVGRADDSSKNGGVRVVEAPVMAKKDEAPPAGSPDKASTQEPIGTSHFDSATPMNVQKGTSAMISILQETTPGELVYLFDPESPRGNAAFPFRAVRFLNPTDSALESGPVSVFGEGRFIGEGMAEPIPARSAAFVPFALDRQIVVERKDAETDAISRILTVTRGVFHTELAHTKKTSFALYNRQSTPATVYVRHTTASGYKLTKAPAEAEKIGGANLYRVNLAAGEKRDLVIEEQTPTFKTTDIRTPGGLDLVRVHLAGADVDPRLRGQLDELLRLHTEQAKTAEQIETVREQMREYRTRMDELHAQVVTLRMVKTAGPLMTHLDKKLQEMSEKLSKATIDLVSLEEKQMVGRVRFQDAVAELSLEKKDPPKDALPKDKVAKVPPAK